MVRKKSVVKFSPKLSILSNENIQHEGGQNLQTKEEVQQSNQSQEEEEGLSLENDDYPSIRIEYTTKRDSIPLNRCLVTPKPPRENVPVFLRRGADSKTFGYTFKTNFIGDTKIISVSATKDHEPVEDGDEFLFRNSLMGRFREHFHDSLATPKRKSVDISDSDSKNKLPLVDSRTKYTRSTRGRDKKSLEVSDVPKRASFKRRSINEFFHASDKKLIFASGNTKFKTDEGVSKPDQFSFQNKAVSKTISHPQEISHGLNESLKEKNIHGRDSTLSTLEGKNKEAVPLEKKIMQLLQQANPQSKLIHQPSFYKEGKEQALMQNYKVKTSEASTPDNNKYQRQETLSKNKSFDPLKVSSTSSAINKRLHHEVNTRSSGAESSLSENRISRTKKGSVVSFKGIPDKSEEYKKSSERAVPLSLTDQISNIINLSSNNSTIIEKRPSPKFSKAENSISIQGRNQIGQKPILVQKSEKDANFNESEVSVADRKDLIIGNNFNKTSKFRTEDFMLSDDNKFLKRPVHLSLQITQTTDGKPNYKIVARKTKFGSKDDNNIYMSKFKFPQILQQFPQIASSKNIMSDEAPISSLENRSNQFAKSSEVQGQLKLPYLNPSFSKLAIHQHKNSNNLVMTHPERSYSSTKFNETTQLEKILRKTNLKETLSLQSNLSELNQLKEQIASYGELLKPEKLETSDKNKDGIFETKMTPFSNSYSLEEASEITKKSIALLSHGYTGQVNVESSSENRENVTRITEDQDQYLPEDNVGVSEYKETKIDNNELLSGDGIEKAARSFDNKGEQVYTEEQSGASGDFRSESKRKLYLQDSSVSGEDEGMRTSNELSSSTSTRSSDFRMNVHSESLQNMVKEYLMSNLTYGEEEMQTDNEKLDISKHTEEKRSIRQEETTDKFEYNYRGTYDVHNLRSGFGCLHWDARESRTYCGYFLYNSLHGKGHYFIKEEKCLNFYNGYLYGNKLYGYGQIVHDNGGKFEGLFKQNSRFGPGVFTHPNGTQDVGIWYGNNLLRLNVDLSKSIPSFGKSMFGKIKLLQFKKEVRLRNPHRDKAKEILENLKADGKTLGRYCELYNPYVRNENSLFFNKSEYDGEYFRNEECYVNISKGWKSHKNIPRGNSMKVNDENEGMSEERIELVKTIENVQAKLTSFRKQIEDLQNKQEVDLIISRSITSPAHVLDETEKNKLYKEELFYSSVLDFLNLKLNRYEQGSVTGASPAAQKVRVHSLLAWNNNDRLLDILLHTFRCRNSEENICFEVKSIIKGERGHFGKSGEHEESCREFLDNCRSGDDYKVLKLLVKHNLNPDVCDSRGNTGLHFAICFNHLNIITILTNNGANLEATNDEGLTPLNLALLRYLEIIYNVRSWEFSFLSKHEVSSFEKKQYSEWIPFESFFISILKTPVGIRRSSYSNHSMGADNMRATIKSARSAPGSFLKIKNMKFLKDLIPDVTDKFIFSLEYNSKLFKLPSKVASCTPLTESSEKKVVSKLKVEKTSYSEEITRKLAGISEMIETLLHYGADPNIDAMPFPPFFISLFTKSSHIVEAFLENNVNPNQLYQGMTPLQIVCCLEPCEELCQIVKVLIQYSADVNILSDPFVWKECDNDLLQDNSTDNTIKSYGKNALHFICLREDDTDVGNAHLCCIAEMLLQAKTETSFLYLGHSYLSIAALKGNTDLIKCLSSFIDIRRPLGFGLGNALTVLALRRYSYVIPFHICKEVIDCLFDLGISPFESLYNHRNIFEFLDTDSPPLRGSDVKSWNTYVTHLKRYKSLINQTPFRPIHANCNIISKIYIQEKSRTILNIIIRFKAVIYLYNFFREAPLNKYTAYLAKLIGSSNEALIYLEVIFRCGKLPLSYYFDDIVMKLSEYVDEVNKNPKNDDIMPQIQNRFNARKMRSIYKYNNFELNRIAEWVSGENLFKCEVCYFCMHKKYKVLLKCPLCGIVKFCSQQCNYLSEKFKTIHACPGLFYQDIFKKNEIFINSNEPIPLYGIDLIFENARNDYQTSEKET